MGLAVSLPPSPESGRPGAPAAPRAGAMGADTFLLQREATGGPGWLQAVAYGAWRVDRRRLARAAVRGRSGLAEPRRQPAPARYAAAPTWPPPAAPA